VQIKVSNLCTSRQLFIQLQFAEVVGKWKEDDVKSWWNNLDFVVIQFFSLNIKHTQQLGVSK